MVKTTTVEGPIYRVAGYEVITPEDAPKGEKGLFVRIRLLEPPNPAGESREREVLTVYESPDAAIRAFREWASALEQHFS